jgi:hypothetical protein
MKKQMAAVAFAVVALLGVQGCHRESPVEDKVRPDVKDERALVQDKAKSTMLTPQEIADGWISLFDGRTLSGWIGQANVTDGAIQLGSDRPLQHSTTFVSFELQFEYKISGDKEQMVTLSWSPSEFIALHVEPTSTSWHRAVFQVVRDGPDTWSSRSQYFSDLRPETKPIVGDDKARKRIKSQNTIRFYTNAMNTLLLRNIKAKPIVKLAEP